VADARDWREDRLRWLRFALQLAALWAAVLGATAYAVTDDIGLLWWGLRLTGGVVAAAGVLGLVRGRGGERQGRTDDTVGWTPGRTLTGVVRVLLGTGVVVATL
jgi:peptidoglycan/LPS O-acetylase OafA/YrhL